MAFPRYICVCIAAILFSLELSAGSAGIAKERKLIEFFCEGVFDGAGYAGPVEVSLWPREPVSEPAIEKLKGTATMRLAKGELGDMPGLVQLDGKLRSPRRASIRFEAYFHDETGDGSIWYIGTRAEERFMRVSLDETGLEFRLLEGAETRLDCRY